MPIKSFLFCLLTSFLLTYSCGPAAEDRSAMVSNAKRVQDSIANVIHTAMAEAEAPGPMVAPPPTSVATPTGPAPANATAAPQK